MVSVRDKIISDNCEIISCPICITVHKIKLNRTFYDRIIQTLCPVLLVFSRQMPFLNRETSFSLPHVSFVFVNMHTKTSIQPNEVKFTNEMYSTDQTNDSCLLW